jgi:hypothetical protein
MDFHLFRKQRVRISTCLLPNMADVSSGFLQAVQKNDGDYRDRFLLDSFQFTVNTSSFRRSMVLSLDRRGRDTAHGCVEARGCVAPVV